MARRIKNLLLFLWRMLYPLILYYIIIYTVITITFIIIIDGGLSGYVNIPDPLFDELNNRLSLLLTGLGAILASFPLGMLYVLFCCKQETAREQAEEQRQARQREAEIWASISQPPNYQEAGLWAHEPGSGRLQPDTTNPYRQHPDKNQTIPTMPVHLPMNPRECLRITLLGFSMCICLNALLLSLPFSWDSFEEVGEMLYTPPFLQQLLCVGLIVPFVEELVFRGLGYAKMRLMLPVIPSMLINALYFGIYHGNLIQGIYATVLGLALAWVMECYGSLSASYILHASANIMSILVSNTILGIFLYVFTLRCGLILICSGVTIFILHKIREDRKDYETSVNCNTLL